MISPRRAAWAAALVCTTGTLTALAAVSVAAGQRQQETVTLKFGYVTTAVHPYGLTLAQFKRIVEERSGGDIRVNLLPSYAQANDIALLNDIRGGVVEGGAVSAAVWPAANIKTFIALQMPGLIDSYQLEQRVINNSSGIAQSMLRNGTQRAGLVGLGFLEGGMRQLALKRQITSLAQLRGLKIRSVESPHLKDALAALGTSPTPLPLGEVFTSLRTGTVDGMEANSALVFAQKFNEAGVSNMVVANLFPFPAVVVMGQQAFDRLTPAQQQIVRDAARDLPAFSISTLSDTSVFPTRLCTAGVRYQNLSASGRRAFLQRMRPVYAKYTKDRQTARYVAAIQKLKARIRGAQATDTPPAGCLLPQRVGG
ncbi:MAG: TRAP transporter substrate-binding protein [Thermoleophilia bacterium]|jgi:TRAP-type C4-dicarboxylate transport system substrate-binding protein|nr:TRAP transporter substrate-binding protein [Thermoleophilia bacterium]